MCCIYLNMHILQSLLEFKISIDPKRFVFHFVVLNTVIITVYHVRTVQDDISAKTAPIWLHHTVLSCRGKTTLKFYFNNVLLYIYIIYYIIVIMYTISDKPLFVEETDCPQRTSYYLFFFTAKFINSKFRMFFFLQNLTSFFFILLNKEFTITAERLLSFAISLNFAKTLAWTGASQDHRLEER